jgi:flavin reductase (DIM6/NTAB) family NADH-FMN oxidoreductase RutF
MSETDTGFDEIVDAANTSVVIVSAGAGGEVDACLVGFHCQCSIEPLRYAIWLSKANRTCRIATKAGALRVHWVPRDRMDLAELAGGMSLDRHPDKMQRLRWRSTVGGTILVEGTGGSFGGEILHTHDDGDHICFVVAPFDVITSDADVLRFRDVADVRAGHDADPDVPPR